jgi:hypothetical protein
MTVSKPVLKAPMVAALETVISINWFHILLSISTCGATSRCWWGSPRRCAHSCTAPPSRRQGLTLVHVSAQLEPCLTHKNTYTPHTPYTHPNTPFTWATQPLPAAPPVP